MVHTKEIWDAEAYNKGNGNQFRDAEELIEQVLSDSSEEVDIIVDIGCGSGNVTKLMSSRIPHKRIYSFDFDAQMVQYANETFNDGTIEYFVQNMDVPWEDLDDRLKKLEGKVDIVWSNRVLHWIKDKKRVVDTIGRLLKKNGRFYSNITLIRDVSEFATPEEKEVNKKYITQWTNEETLDKWTEFFKSALTKVDVKFFQKKWVYDSEEQFNSIEINASNQQARNLILRDDVPEEEKEAAIKKYAKLLLTSYTAPYGTNYLDGSYKWDGRVTYYEQFRITGSK